MKIQIIKGFVDKTGKQLNVGDIVEWDDSRCQKAEQMGLAKVVKDVPVKTKSEPVEEQPKTKRKIVKK